MASTFHEPPLKDEQIQKGDAQIQEQEEHSQEKEVVHEQKGRSMSAEESDLRLHERTESELVETQKNCTSPSDEWDSLRADLAKIKLDLEKSLDLRSVEESLDEHDKEIKALKAGYRVLNDKISTMKEEKEKLKEEKEELKEEKEELEVAVKAAGADIAEAANFYACLEDDTTSMKAELERVSNEQKDMKTVLSDLAVKVSSMDAEMDDMKIKMKPLLSWCDAIKRDQ